MNYLANQSLGINRLPTILVTGAGGFIGTELCNNLSLHGNNIIAIARNKSIAESAIIVEDIAKFDDWRATLDGINIIVHLAGRAHILKDQTVDPLAEFRRVNTRATINLAKHAAAAGVKRFVFISSIGVNGEVTRDRPFSVSDVPNPYSHFSRSKYEAELALHDIARKTGLEAVIIRPPLVYGSDAPGNFASMMRWLTSGIPLPLGSITKNRRSFISLGNLVDLIEVCINHPSAANRTFLVSDGDDLSTTDLLRRLSRFLGKQPRLLPIPPALLRTVAVAVGQGRVAQRLLDDLRIDIQHTCDTLDWRPPFSVDEGLAKAAVSANLL